MLYYRNCKQDIHIPPFVNTIAWNRDLKVLNININMKKTQDIYIRKILERYIFAHPLLYNINM